MQSVDELGLVDWFLHRLAKPIAHLRRTTPPSPPPAPTPQVAIKITDTYGVGGGGGGSFIVSQMNFFCHCSQIQGCTHTWAQKNEV